jgi:hypothetical protein
VAVHIVPGPQPPGELALQRQLTDQLGQLRVVDVPAGPAPQDSDQIGGGGLLIGWPILGGEAQKDSPQQVAAYDFGEGPDLLGRRLRDTDVKEGHLLGLLHRGRGCCWTAPNASPSAARRTGSTTSRIPLPY